MGEFITLRGMAEAKTDLAALNGEIRRGEHPEGSYVTFIPCGCGADHVLPTIRRPIEPVEDFKWEPVKRKPTGMRHDPKLFE